MWPLKIALVIRTIASAAKPTGEANPDSDGAWREGCPRDHIEMGKLWSFDSGKGQPGASCLKIDFLGSRVISDAALFLVR